MWNPKTEGTVGKARDKDWEQWIKDYRLGGAKVDEGKVAEMHQENRVRRQKKDLCAFPLLHLEHCSPVSDLPSSAAFGSGTCTCRLLSYWVSFWGRGLHHLFP